MKNTGMGADEPNRFEGLLGEKVLGRFNAYWMPGFDSPRAEFFLDKEVKRKLAGKEEEESELENVIRMAEEWRDIATDEPYNGGNVRLGLSSQKDSNKYIIAIRLDNTSPKFSAVPRKHLTIDYFANINRVPNNVLDVSYDIDRHHSIRVMELGRFITGNWFIPEDWKSAMREAFQTKYGPRGGAG